MRRAPRLRLLSLLRTDDGTVLPSPTQSAAHTAQVAPVWSAPSKTPAVSRGGAHWARIGRLFVPHLAKTVGRGRRHRYVRCPT